MSECMMPTCPVNADRDGMCAYHRRQADIPREALQRHMTSEHARHQHNLESGHYERIAREPVVLKDAMREVLPKLSDGIRVVANSFQDMGKAVDGFQPQGYLSDEEEN